MKNRIFRIIVSIWNINPLKKQIKRIVNLFPNIKNKLYKDLRYKGVMDVRYKGKNFKLYNPGFTTIENEIFWNGLGNGWEQISLHLWTQLAEHSKVILDIGANSGVYSFLASAINPNAHIISFEPVQRTAAIFLKNLELNKNVNIKLYQKAVSNKNEITTFYDVDSPSQYSASLNAEMLKGASNRISYEVETVMLDTLLSTNTQIDLIKLDVEMHEPEAIEGMIQIIEKFHPTILIEVLSEDIAKKIDILIGHIGYEIYSIDEINKPKKLKQITASDHYNLLLIKNDKNIYVEF